MEGVRRSCNSCRINPGSFKAKYLSRKTDYLASLKRLAKCSSLLTAAATNNTQMVRELLEKGTDPNSSDEIQRSALHMAVSRGYIDVIKLLLEHGANPNIHDLFENTPLHLAACSNNLRIITLLINGGADVHSRDRNGRNPLQLAKSKLDLLKKQWIARSIESIQVETEMQTIVDFIVSVQKQLEPSDIVVGELNLLNLNTNEQVDQQLDKLMSQLDNFAIS